MGTFLYCTFQATVASFAEDFADGNADGLNLGTGWEIKLENGNHVLSGLSDNWSQARLKVSGWFNYIYQGEAY